jgi:hypothetical protein
MARSGPVTKDASKIALGLAQIRVETAVTNIAEVGAQLTAAASIGALASTKYIGNVDWYKFESGFPLLEDLLIPLREAAAIECAFNELSVANLSLAHGLATAGSDIKLGARTAPDYLRVEAVYTFPNGTDTMTIIFPRAQIAASVEMDMQKEDAVAVPITFEAKRADSEVTGGNAVWDNMPLGHIVFSS